MNNRKWLKRKYSLSFEKANEFLNDSELITFKERKYKLGTLINQVAQYKPGTLLMFKKTKITDFNHPSVHAIFKCLEKGYTESGYHSIDIGYDDFKEIKK